MTRENRRVSTSPLKWIAAYGIHHGFAVVTINGQYNFAGWLETRLCDTIKS